LNFKFIYTKGKGTVSR